jgi:ferredoxin
MDAVRVDVDMDLCQSHGECAFAAPEVFELGEDDVLKWVEHPDESQRDAVEQAVLVCPVAAISLSD